MREPSFGEYIRKLRGRKQEPLRRVAASLDIDPSTLGKIERNTRKPTKDLIAGIGKFYGVAEEELLVYHLSDKIADELRGFSKNREVLREARRKLKNH